MGIYPTINYVTWEILLHVRIGSMRFPSAPRDITEKNKMNYILSGPKYTGKRNDVSFDW